jgi:hypothetical protein
MLLHVSILRSSSGSVNCSLLKLYVKRYITLLYLFIYFKYFKCFIVKILDYYNIIVHSLVCNELSESIVHGATVKIVKRKMIELHF